MKYKQPYKNIYIPSNNVLPNDSQSDAFPLFCGEEKGH